jgi:ketosteroid isomerase-like protein
LVGEPTEEAIMMNNVEFVKSLYAAFTRGDLDTIFAACDPNIEWISNSDPALIPWGGERKGIDGARSFFREVAAHVEYESFQPRDFLPGSDFVTVLGHSIARVRPSGGRVDGEWIHLFKIENGKVVSFRDYCDTHALVQAYFGGDIHAVTVAPSEATARFQH